MLSLRILLPKSQPKHRDILQLRRHISALYITGDKAKENYVTLQPFLDFAGAFIDRAALEQSITKRGLDISLESVLSKYQKFQLHHDQLHRLDEEREAVTKQLKALTKAGSAATEEQNTLKERGKALRNEVKALKQMLYPIEDDFIHDFLHLPNHLHAQCPDSGQDKLIYRSKLPQNTQKQTSHLERKDLVHFVDNNCYYLMEQAAHFDVDSMQSLVRYFVGEGGFIQTANPDFVRCVLLEANATPLSHYHLVKEEQLQNKLNVAYLTGGGSFESFLGDLTKLCIYPSVLPLRYVACGRSYSCADAESNGPEPSLYTATQTNAVQTLVATQTAAEAEEQLEHILNLAIDFYKALDIPFRVVYTGANLLTPAECLRASIEVFAPSVQRFVCVGRVSNYSDFVSKRILFSMRREKHFDFLHLVGGPLLFTTRLIASLIEHNISLEDCKLLGANKTVTETAFKQDIHEFKSLFK